MSVIKYVDVELIENHFRIVEKDNVSITDAALQTVENIQAVVSERLEYVKEGQDEYSKLPQEKLYLKLKDIAAEVRKRYLEKKAIAPERGRNIPIIKWVHSYFNKINVIVNGIENLVSPPDFLRLPSEVIVHILSFLRITEIWKSFCICKDLVAHAKATECLRGTKYAELTKEKHYFQEKYFLEAKKMCIEMYANSPRNRQSLLNKKLYECSKAEGAAIAKAAVELPMLLECGADPNGLTDNWDNSPLIWAAKMNKPYSVIFLLIYGANPNQRNKEGETALHWAMLNVSPKMVQDLLEFGSNTEGVVNKTSHTPLLCHPCRQNNCDALALLVKHKNTKLNHQDNGGNTLLHFAAGVGNAAVVKLLLEHGADRNIKCKAGPTPFEVAKAWGNKDSEKYKEVISLLESYYPGNKGEGPNVSTS
jgi:hypothetical protein